MKFPRNADNLRSQTNLANWRQAPFNRWAFHNVRQVVPTAPVAPSNQPWELTCEPRDLSALSCTDRNGTTRSFNQVLVDSHTDAVLVMQGGRILEERYFNGMVPCDQHILMSVSKSVTAALAGVLVDSDRLDPEAEVSDYIDALGDTGFAGATLQQVLDMRTGLAFDEDYSASEGVMIEYRESTGWNPPGPQTPPGGLHDFLLRQDSDRAHGGYFQYTSPNTDLLGWIIESVMGDSLARLMSRYLWQPMGGEFEAYITVDRFGASRAAGGINATLRDLARLGQCMLQQGIANGDGVLPAWWIHDTTTGGDDEAWRNGNFAHLLPQGRYRNQWYQYGNDLGAYCGIGIHGQFLYVAPKASVVIAHFGSHPQPFNPDAEALSLDAFDSVARALA